MSSLPSCDAPCTLQGHLLTSYLGTIEQVLSLPILKIRGLSSTTGIIPILNREILRSWETPLSPSIGHPNSSKAVVVGLQPRSSDSPSSYSVNTSYFK